MPSIEPTSPPQRDAPVIDDSVRTQVVWRDSREAALRVLRPAASRAFFKLVSFALATALALAAWRALTISLPTEQRAVLFLLVLSIGLWATEAVPAFAVGFMILGYLVLVLGTDLVLPEPWDVTPYTNMWASPVIWLILGGFFLAEGMSRTGLDRKLLTVAIRPAGTRPDRVLLALMLTSAAASMFISNTSTTVLLVGAVLPLCRRMDRDDPFARGLLVAIPLSAAVGGMGTIIGSAPNAIAAGSAAEFGRTVDFVEWMMIGAPIALVLVLVGWAFVLRRYPPRVEEISFDVGDDDPGAEGRRERIIVGAVAAVTVGLWMTTPLHGIHTAAISLIPIAALTMTQIVEADRVRQLPWDTLILVAGGLALGAAVVDTGLAERLASALGTVTGLGSAPLVYLVLALVTVALSNVMSNTATVSVVLPVSVALLPGRELETCLILGLSASCALLLPVSTPPNAVAFSTGELETRDFRPGGILIGLLGPIVVIAWVLLISESVVG